MKDREWDALHEFEMAQKITHKHEQIVKFYQFIKTTDTNNFYLVYEYGNMGSLKSFLMKR